MKEGSLEDGIHYMLFDPNLRTECYKFAHKFNEGVQESLRVHGASNKMKKNASQKIRQYNPIF